MNSINEIIDFYNRSIESTSKHKADEAGSTRSEKGKLVEDIAEMLISCAWRNIGGNQSNLSFVPPHGENKQIKIPINPDFLVAINEKSYELNDISEILENEEIENYYYNLNVDKHVYINNKFVVGVECKSYTENAMIKRTFVDFTLLKSIYGEIDCFLLQLETQLGGENTSPGSKVFSQSTVSLMSYFMEINLHIITLLEGQRKVNEPIHKDPYKKELKYQYVEYAIKKFEEILIKHL